MLSHPKIESVGQHKCNKERGPIRSKMRERRINMGPFWGVVFHENTSSKSKSKGAELIWAMRLCWTQCKVHIYYHPVNNNHNVMEKNFGLQNLFHKMRIFLGTVKNLLREGFN